MRGLVAALQAEMTRRNLPETAESHRAMMSSQTQRTAAHRCRLRTRGMRQIDVIVPEVDAMLLRRVAAVLRDGGEAAERLRRAVEQAGPNRPAASGAELVAFFRSSPLLGEDLTDERDRSSGRPLDLGS
jgi:hypothetical protein